MTDLNYQAAFAALDAQHAQKSDVTDQHDWNYDAAFAALDSKAHKREKQALSVLNEVVPRNPDKEAEAQEIAGYYGVAVDAVRKRQDEYSRAYRATTLHDAMSASPILQRQMRNVQFASLAYDDIEPLAGIENALTGTARDLGIPLSQGLVGVPQFFAGLGNLVVESGVEEPVNALFGTNYNFWTPREALAKLGVDFEGTKAQLGTYHTPGFKRGQRDVNTADGFMNTLAALAQNPIVAVSQIIQFLPAMAVGGGISRGLSTFLPKRAALGVGEGLVSTGLSASQFSQNGLTRDEATAALMSGLFTASIGGYASRVADVLRVPNPENILASGFREASDSVRQRFIFSVLGAGLTEGVLEELPQSIQEQMWANFAHDQPLLEGVGNVSATGLLLGSTVGAAFGGVQHMASKRMQKAVKAQDMLKRLQDTAKFAEASKVRERDNTTFESLVRDAAEEGEVETVYLDSGVLLQSDNADELADISPSIAAQYQQAVATGGTIAIPMAEYASTIAPSEFNDELMPHLRVGDPEAFTATEADEYINNMQEDLQEQADELVGQLRDRSEFDESAERVKQTLIDELQATGRLAERNVEPTAALYSSYYNVRAAQMGIAPEQMLERMRVGFQAAQQAEGLEQGGIRTVDLGEVDRSTPIPDGVRNVRNETRAAFAGQSVATADGDEIHMPWQGIKRATAKATHDSLAVVRNLPNVLSASTHITEAADAKGRNNIKAVHTYAANVVINGEPKTALLFVRETNEGQLFYDNAVVEERPAGISGEAGITSDASNSIQPSAGLGESINPNASFEQPSDYDFDASQYRDSVVKWAQKRFGDAIAPNGKPTWQNFVRWFGDSVVVNANGQPRLMWHQTSRENAQGIYESGFDTDKPGARAGDPEVPDGIFFKPSSEDITVGSSADAEQIPVFISLSNPLVVNDRADLIEALADATGYQDARNLVDAIDLRISTEYDRRTTEHRQELEDKGLERGDPENKRLGKAHYAAMDELFAAGEQEFNEAAADARRLLTEYLAANGYDGVVINWDAGSFGRSVSTYVALRSSQTKSATNNTGNFAPDTGNILFQGEPRNLLFQQARGSFDPETFMVSLMTDSKPGRGDGSNLTTALHEGAHFFFEADMALAGQLLNEAEQFGDDVLTDGEREILDNVHNLFNWHGIEGPLQEQLALWASMDNEQRRHYHERTAETFEHYLFSGQAPSFELQTYFQRYRAWMLSVYASIKNFLAKNGRAEDIDPEIKAVFDRMLATTEQIQTAEQGRSMLPLFNDVEESGMTPEAYAAYQRQDVNASNDATDELQAKALRDLQYTKNIRNDELKRLRREAKAVRREVRMAVRKEVMQQPVYQAWQWLTKKLGEADQLPAQERATQDTIDATTDSLFVAMAKLGGVNREEIVNQWGLDPADAKGIGYGYKNQPVVRAEGGKSLDAMREALREDGYLGGDFGETTDALQSSQHDFEEAFFSELGGDGQYSRAYVPEVEMAAGEQAANPGDVTAGRLDLDALQLEYGDEQIAQLKSYRMTGKNGWHPDLVAQRFGYDSGEALIDALLTSTPPNAWIEVVTDRRMAEEHAELATEEGLEQAADAAIHSRTRARVVATEANALDQAIGGKRALMRAASEMADAVIARLQLREIKPSRYASAAARAAKAAKRAFKKGETEVAATEKRNELAQLQIANKAYKARQEIDKHLRFLREFNKGKLSLDPEYLTQIQGLLEKYELRSISDKQAQRNLTLRDWVLGQIEQGIIPDISESILAPDDQARYLAQVSILDQDGMPRYPDEEARLRLLAGYIENSKRRPYKSLTMEELRALVDTVKQIENLGRLKHKYLSDREQRSFEAVRRTVVDSIGDNAKGKATSRSPVTNREKAAETLKKFGTQHIKIATWARIFDGGKDGGSVWEAFIRPANRASTREVNMRAHATERLTQILEPVLKSAGLGNGFHRKTFFPSIDQSLTRESVFVMALNMGNLSNRQRLLDGDGWTMAQLRPVLNTLTAEDWQAVQQVWDYSEEYWPEVQAQEIRIYGKAPERVEPQPFTVTTADGQTIEMRGGYYPVKYDNMASSRASELDAQQQAKQQMKGAFTSSTTRRSFAKSRVEEVKGRPVLLRLDGVYNGFNEVIHDLAWHEYLIDVNRMLRSESVRESIRTHYGQRVVDEFKRWVEDIANEGRNANDTGEAVVGFIRQGVGVSILGYSFWTAALQVTGLGMSIPRVGSHWIGRSLRGYMADSVGRTRQAKELSGFMANRSRNRFRELNELQNQVAGKQGKLNAVAQNSYMMIQFVQQITDTITWWAAYDKAISEGHTDDLAVDVADQSVIDAQGSGELKDRAGVERGGKWQKLFTVFYTFMNAQLNMIYGQAKTQDSKAKLAADAFWLMLFPSLSYSLLRSALTPGDDDDEFEPGKLALELTSQTLGDMMGLFIGVRELSSIPDWLITGHGFDYQGPAGLVPLTSVMRLAAQTSQGEFDEAWRNAFIDTLGPIMGLPSTQIGRTIEGGKAILEGKTDNPVESAASLAFGFNTNN